MTAGSGICHNLTMMQWIIFSLYAFDNTLHGLVYTALVGHSRLLAGPSKSMAGHSDDLTKRSCQPCYIRDTCLLSYYYHRCTTSTCCTITKDLSSSSYLWNCYYGK